MACVSQLGGFSLAGQRAAGDLRGLSVTWANGVYSGAGERVAAEQHASMRPRARFEALARAYRSWALDQPHRYRLLFGPPLPGYDAHAQRLVDASQAAMSELLGVLRELDDRTAPGPPEPLASQLTVLGVAHGPCIGPATALRAVLVWSCLHGLVSLEIAGNFSSMGIDPGQAFEAQLATL